MFSETTHFVRETYYPVSPRDYLLMSLHAPLTEIIISELCF